MITRGKRRSPSSIQRAPAVTQEGRPPAPPDPTAPLAHHITHENGGSDELSVAGLSGLLADPQTPTAHTHPESAITGLLADLSTLGSSITAVDAAAEHVSRRNAASGYAGLDASSKLTGSQQVYGTATNTAAQGNDSRLSDARTPTAHAASHAAAGSDPVSVTGLGGFPGGTTTFLRADGTFQVPSAGTGLTQAQVLARASLRG